MQAKPPITKAAAHSGAVSVRVQIKPSGWKAKFRLEITFIATLSGLLALVATLLSAD